MSNAWFNSRIFGNGVVSRKDLFELMMRHKPLDNGDGSKERYAYIEWLGIYQAIRELPSADRPQVNAELRADFLKRQYESALEEIKRLKADRPQDREQFGKTEQLNKFQNGTS